MMCSKFLGNLCTQIAQEVMQKMLAVNVDNFAEVVVL